MLVFFKARSLRSITSLGEFWTGVPVSRTRRLDGNLTKFLYLCPLGFLRQWASSMIK